MRIDVHTHHYPAKFFELIERSGGDFSFATDPAGRRIIRYKGSRFFGITPAMTDSAAAALKVFVIDAPSID